MLKELHLVEIKKIQIDILNSFVSFCEANGLTYYLAYGTLIGAVRHKGYIPWDDDVDVIMPRPDYIHFITKYKNERYKVFCPEKDKDCPFTYGKLFDSQTILKEHTSRNYQIGLNIDIFILDGMPEDDNKALMHIKKCKPWLNIMDVKKIAYNKKRSIIKNLILFSLKLLFSPLPYNTVRNKVIKLNKMYDYNSSVFCSDLCYTSALHLPKSVFGSGIMAQFEDREYMIPKDYHTWLSRVYGDYMTLPPLENRITHHDYIAYLK